jgi:hypothetical protein
MSAAVSMRQDAATALQPDTHRAETHAKSTATTVVLLSRWANVRRQADEESAQLEFAEKCCLLHIQPNLRYCCSQDRAPYRLLPMPCLNQTDRQFDCRVKHCSNMDACLADAQQQLTSHVRTLTPAPCLA